MNLNNLNQEVDRMSFTVFVQLPLIHCQCVVKIAFFQINTQYKSIPYKRSCVDYSEEKKESFSCYTGTTVAPSNYKIMGKAVQIYYVNDLISK